jgi:CBS domain-containing protein
VALVKDIMSDCVETVRARATVKEAAGRMRAFDVGALPVCDNGALVGIITDRDIAVRVIAAGKHAASTSVSDVMSQDVICCRPDQDTEIAARVMQVNQIRRLPVLDEGGQLCGIISLGDLARVSGEDLIGRVLGGIVQPIHALHSF